MFNIFGFLKRKKKEQPKVSTAQPKQSVSPAPITANPSTPSDDPSMSFAVAAMTGSALAGYVAGKNLPFAVLGEVTSSSSSSSSYDSGYSSSSSSSSFGD